MLRKIETMAHSYDSIDVGTRAALEMSPQAIREGLADRARYFTSPDQLAAEFAAHLLDDFRNALGGGRERVAFIIPVGPVGQYQRLASTVAAAGLSLDRLTLILMDEYLDDRGNWISESDPLSFRGHVKLALLEALPGRMRPQLVIPDPREPENIAEVIQRNGGVEVCYAGVGITGHLAFNDPLPDVHDTAYFADLPTRVVPLCEQTRLINAVTASRGNVLRIPRLAITVGMREILASRKLRIYMNRQWQSAALRRMAFGPVTAAFPASLVQLHRDWSLNALEEVVELPEPELR